MPFTTTPKFDKLVADECSKSTKTSDSSIARIQALFLDAVGPLTQLLDDINKESQVSIEEVEGAVKAALTFLGNTSAQCNSLRRTNILREYNKDLVSFGLESVSSATTSLFGPEFPQKAAAHLQQMETLRRAAKPKQVFYKAPSHFAQRGGKSYSLQRRHNPYNKGGNRSRGPSHQKSK